MPVPVPILAASDLTQALTLIIATFGFYSDFGALILEHVSEIMADTCNVNTRINK